MNKTQWSVLSIACSLLMFWFIFQDNSFRPFLSSILESEPLTVSDIYFLINNEIYEPFIWVLGGLGFTFLICSWLEPSNKE